MPNDIDLLKSLIHHMLKSAFVGEYAEYLPHALGNPHHPANLCLLGCFGIPYQKSSKQLTSEAVRVLGIYGITIVFPASGRIKLNADIPRTKCSERGCVESPPSFKTTYKEF